MANPGLLIDSAEQREQIEASPNLSGVGAKIKRSKTVVVLYLNAQGVMIDRKEFSDLAAASVQHQIDHLNGKMYFDNLSKLRRDMLLRKARKTS